MSWTGLFGVPFCTCIESSAQGTTNKVAADGTTRRRMLRSWWPVLEVPAKDVSSRRGIQTLGCRSSSWPSSRKATCSRRACSVAWLARPPLHRDTSRIAAGDGATLQRLRGAEVEEPLFRTRSTRQSESHSGRRRRGEQQFVSAV